MFRFISLFLLVFGLVTPSFASEPVRTILGFIIDVADGNKITVVSYGTKLEMRLYGIDAPVGEKARRRTGGKRPGQPYGEEAYLALKEKIDQRWIRYEIVSYDRHKRAVAIIWHEGRNINLEMVREGHAWAYRKYLDRLHAAEYIGAEEKARAENRGLWQQLNPQPPREFRRSQRQSDKEPGPSPFLAQPYED
jgi:micrococcal nuclease